MTLHMDETKDEKKAQDEQFIIEGLAEIYNHFLTAKEFEKANKIYALLAKHRHCLNRLLKKMDKED